MVVLVDFHRQKVNLVAIDGDYRESVDNVPFCELEPVDRVNLANARWKSRPEDERRAGM
jgi:hypothetical protein